MRGVVLLIIILLVLSVVMRLRKNSNKCPCDKQKRIRDLLEQDGENCGRQKGLNELEQDTMFRGVIPQQNQPDHIANLWKCENSHPKILEGAGAGCMDTVFASDYPTPLRGAAVNQNVDDVSNMHLVSRFAVTRS
jgi:hypothetical protein